MNNFSRKHPKILMFLCKHQTASDIGQIRLWDGSEKIVIQCDICGLIKIGDRDNNWYTLPKDFPPMTYHKMK
jgi:hypothetical protein